MNTNYIFNLHCSPQFINQLKSWIYTYLSKSRWDIDDANDIISLSDKYYKLIEYIYDENDKLITKIEEHLLLIERKDVFTKFIESLKSNHDLYNNNQLSTCKKLILEATANISRIYNLLQAQFEKSYNSAIKGADNIILLDLIKIYRTINSIDEKKTSLNTINNLCIDFQLNESSDKQKTKGIKKIRKYIEIDINSSKAKSNNKNYYSTTFKDMLKNKYKPVSEELLYILEDTKNNMFDEKKKWIHDKAVARIFFDILKEEELLDEQFKSLNNFKAVFVRIFPGLNEEGFKKVNTSGRIYTSNYDFIKKSVINIKNSKKVL